MKRSEILNTLENLVYFKDVEITHTFDEYTITYCKNNKAFYVGNNKNGDVAAYSDIDSCAIALFDLLNKKSQVLAE